MSLVEPIAYLFTSLESSATFLKIGVVRLQTVTLQAALWFSLLKVWKMPNGTLCEAE